MELILSAWVDGEPKPQPRPRAFSRGGHARVFDPGTAEGWKSQVALAVKPHLPVEVIEGPVTVQIIFFVGRPKSHFGAGKNAGRLRVPVRTYPTGKPDLDNYAKAIMDCLTQLRLWRDDAQVVELTTRKLYGGPGADIRVSAL